MGCPAERLSMRQIREVLRLRFASKLAAAGNRQEPGAELGSMLTKARCCAMLGAVPHLKEAAPCRPLSLFQPADTALSPTSSNILAGLLPSQASASSARAS